MLKLIEKTLKFRGKEETIYFREPSVADAAKLIRNTKAMIGQDGKISQEIDFAAEYERNLLLLQLTQVNAGGAARVWPSVQALQNQSATYVNELNKLAKEAEKQLQEDQGNG